MAGFVKFDRDYLDHEVFQDEGLWRLFSWCLMSANYLPSSYLGMSLQPGQFAVGRVSSGALLKIPESTFDRRMKRLEKMGLISRKANSRFTVVTVNQTITSEESEKQSDTAGDTTSDTANGQQVIQPVIQRTDTEEERKKKERKKEEGAPASPPPGGGQKPKSKPKTGEVMADQINYPAVLDTSEVRSAVADWLEHKRGKGERYKTATSAQAIFKNGDWPKLGAEGFVAAVNHSIGNNYSGIFVPKATNGGSSRRDQTKSRIPEIDTSNDNPFAALNGTNINGHN